MRNSVIGKIVDNPGITGPGMSREIHMDNRGFYGQYPRLTFIVDRLISILLIRGCIVEGGLAGDGQTRRYYLSEAGITEYGAQMSEGLQWAHRLQVSGGRDLFDTLHPSGVRYMAEMSEND